MRSGDIEQPEKWIKQYFWFLIEKYNFRYKGYTEGHVDFTSEKVKIRIEPGHKSPYTYIYRVGEPDFTRLVFERIIQYFEGKVPEIDFTLHSLEHNIRYMANILESHAPRIIDQIDDWWIAVQLFQYKLLEETYRESGQIKDFLYSFKRDHDYLKSKGVIE